MSRLPNPTAEWLEPDGLGGFASGTVSGARTRRYHALLLVATQPPTGRYVLLNGLEAWVEAPDGARSFLSSQRYLPGVTHPDGASRLRAFTSDPWPRWTWALDDGLVVEQELLVPRGAPAVALAWRLDAPRPGWALVLRPLLSGRDYHALHHESPAFRFEPEGGDGRLVFRPYAGPPAVELRGGFAYRHEPVWYRNFLYEEEQARGLDASEDLAAPGLLRFDLGSGSAVLVARALDAPQEGTAAALVGDETLSPRALVDALQTSERQRRAGFATRLERSADAYLVRRGAGRTVVAGYPWFTDWGRDTFIALRGLCLATGRLEEARRILVEWAGVVSHGMLPNLFPDHGGTPEYNSVDASLWYVVAVNDYLEAARRRGALAADDESRLRAAVVAILDGFAAGTRHGIRADADGLLAAGAPGVQLTWMDAKVGDWVVTPRVGKPVEVQALWLNALRIGAGFDPRFEPLFERGRAAFAARFWDEARGGLYDVVDADHVPGRLDASLRPNQILAVGGLPLALLEGPRARSVVDLVERELLTPLGLRSLGRGEPGYAPRYEGGVRERDGSYHQGTVWPWLIGPFVEAWVRVRGGGDAVRSEARERFVAPLLRHLDEAGLGHVSEIADADSPHAPKGCPFQAWSVGELLRLEHVVLAGAGCAAAGGRAGDAQRTDGDQSAGNGFAAAADAGGRPLLRMALRWRDETVV